MRPFARAARERVSDWGETGLIERIRGWLGDVNPPAPRGIGDDCAVLPARGDRPGLVTVDPVVYGRHFDDSVPPAAVGGKLLKRNASDIAAMGGRPTEAVVSLLLPPDVSKLWIRKFHRGLASTAARLGIRVVGGDVAQAPALSASLTLLGTAGPRVLTRHGGRNGDHLFVTGELGGSLLGKHHRFEPRLAEGAWLARQPDVRALMDVSDGLAKDLRSLTTSSLEPWINPDHLPVARDAHRLARRTGRAALDHALCDGEDFELVFVVDRRTDPAAFLRRWPRRFPVRAHWIGGLCRPGHSPQHSLNPLAWKGYEHLAAT